MHETPTLYLMTGRTGAGKSTISKKMAGELPALHLSHDELLAMAYGDDIGRLDFADCCRRMDELIWRQAQRLHALGIDVVLEGYGSRAMRDGARLQATRIGFVFQMIWVDCPAQERLRRVRLRNQSLNDEGSFITDDDFHRMEALDGLQADETATIVDNSTPR